MMIFVFLVLPSFDQLDYNLPELNIILSLFSGGFPMFVVEQGVTPNRA